MITDKNKKITTPLTILGIFIVVFIVSSLFSHLVIKEEANLESIAVIPLARIPDVQTSTENKVAQLEVQNNTATLQIGDDIYKEEIEEGTSVSDFMKQIKEKGQLNFEEKNYAGLGKLIEEINGIKGDGNRYWIYYVNGEKAKIGISNYKINPGDTVTWKYQTDTD